MTGSNIEVRQFPEMDLTLNRVRGTLLLTEVKSTVFEFYRERLTTLVIWDLSLADLSKIDNLDLRKLAEKLSPLKRENGKTAFFADNELNYGIARIICSRLRMNRVGFELNCFNHIDELARWLELDSQDVEKLLNASVPL